MEQQTVDACKLRHSAVVNLLGIGIQNNETFSQRVGVFPAGGRELDLMLARTPMVPKNLNFPQAPADLVGNLRDD